MVAKIADLGVARIVPSLRAATMTKAPGASIYMPPEALEDESRYDITIDIFSMGVLAIFILSQTFPKPLSAAYMDAQGAMVGRTELERRGNHMQLIQRQLREGHPLIQMIQRCLKNRPKERPTIQEVVQFLEQARAEIDDGEYDVSKLALVQTLSQRTDLSKIEDKVKEIRSLRQQVTAKDEQIKQQQEQIDCMSKQTESQQAEIIHLKRQLQVCSTATYMYVCMWS